MHIYVCICIKSRDIPKRCAIGNYPLKTSNRNTRKNRKIGLKPTIQTPE